MDLIKIGQFIAELRREKGLTQEQLGEKLGVTNKTVSRWENGNYLPNVEMLQLLGREFGVDINELLCGERLSDSDYRESAEENVVTVMRQSETSSFTLQEKCEFFRKKWRRDHRGEIIVEVILFAAAYMTAAVLDSYWLGAAVSALGVWEYFRKRNEMMTYIENRAFDGKGKGER